MVAKLPPVKVAEGFYKLKDKLLKCEPDTFHHQEFLKKRLCVSDQLLTLFVETIENWSSNWYNYSEQETFRNSFLEETSWIYTHHQDDHHPVNSFTVVFEAIESALNHRSKQYDEWWKIHESSLRQTPEAALAYLLIQAYRQNIESNISGIEAFLNREEVLQRVKLKDEVSELVMDAYFYFSTEFQEQFQIKILSLTSPYNEENVTEEEPFWLFRQRYFYLCWIPKLFRLPEVQTFIEKWEHRFGLWPQPPDFYLRGGFVGSPVSVEQMMFFSEETLVKLFKHYNQYFVERDILGGTEHVISSLEKCCSLDPLKFSSFIEKIYAENIYGGYAVAIMRGVASHLEYRFGNIRPADDWQPVTPLPDGNALALLVLNWLIKYPDVWQDGYTVAGMLRACCHILSTPEEVEELTMLLWRLANHHDPKETDLEQDLGMVSLNSVRGKVADSVMILATNLLEKGRPWPELLHPLLLKFTQDSVAGIRVSILTRLPLLAHYDSNLGWKIFHRTLKNSLPQLWVYGEQFLYYQYQKNFTQVQLCLNRIKEEAIETAGAVWGRIATLAYLSGHLTEEELFEQLSQLNHQETWLRTIQVFCANLDGSKHKLTCEQGLLRILKCEMVLSSREVRQKIDNVFKKLDKSSEKTQLADAFIEFLNDDELCKPHLFFVEWIAEFANEEPQLALKVCEKLLDKFEKAGCSHPFWHGKPLVKAAISILREADEIDDSELIKRAIYLQDKLLELGVSEITEALDKMARNT
jgi:TfoX/Sxy family transcriptional regulator of competence genes